ncbi:hypothetical protein HZS_4405 [Henneguya salminicola]|nr:hypothetical protein HZS_4405 [Henneguya salminicola]
MNKPIICCLDHRESVLSNRLIPPIYICKECSNKLKKNHIYIDYYSPIQNKLIIMKQFTNFNQVFAACQMPGCSRIANYLCYKSVKNEGIYICNKCHISENHQECYYLLNPYFDDEFPFPQTIIDERCFYISTILYSCACDVEKELDIFALKIDINDFLIQSIHTMALCYKLSIFLFKITVIDHHIKTDLAFSYNFNELCIRSIIKSTLSTLLSTDILNEFKELQTLIKFISFSSCKIISCIEKVYPEYLKNYIYPINNNLIYDKLKYITRQIQTVSSLIYHKCTTNLWWNEWITLWFRLIVDETPEYRCDFRKFGK